LEPGHHDGVQTTTFRTRTAGAEDAGAVAEIKVTSWRAGYAGIVPVAVLAALDVDEVTAQWQQILGDAASKGQRTVLVTNGAQEVGGFASVGPYQLEQADEPDRADRDPDGELMACYLHPDWWGRGAADPLIAAAESALAALSHRVAGLWVFEENSRARRFYERNGWEADGVRRHNPIGGVNVPRLRYRKNLTS
jgi:GNAT superfamily N-acetyltransferase